MTAPTTYCNECGASNPLQAIYCFACNSALQPLTPSHLLQVETAFTNTSVPASKIIGPLFPSYLLHSRYSIVSQVGTGGFGAVYQAKDTLFSHRLVAIKEMNQDGLSPRELAEATATFEREALLLSDLTHPNLPRIHDHFSEHNRSYVVMDFIAGDTLEDFQDKVVQRLPLEMVLEIGIQLCSVLDYLHTHEPPIIFRDIKPLNIMRTADNHVYLIDFGIARHFKPGKAKDTIPLGSKGYAAPEQYGKAQTTPQTDIYGLGATLHQLLTGDDPSLTLFHFKPVQASQKKMLPIASQLNALLEQMLEMEMSKRPASMGIVKQELQRLLAQQTAHYQSHAQSSSQAPVKRRRFLIGLASTLVTCSLGSGIATFAVKNQDMLDALFAHPISGTTPVLSTASSVPAQATILNRPLYTYREHLGMVTAAAWSPNGKHIAPAGSLDGTVQVWDAYTGYFVVVPGKDIIADFATNSLRVDALAWSPDCLHIAAALGNDTVDSWSIETGVQIPLFPSPNSYTNDANALAWSPNGMRLVLGNWNGQVQAFDANTGLHVIDFQAPDLHQQVEDVIWLPDGKSIAACGDDHLVWVWNASTGQLQRTYSGHNDWVISLACSPDGKYIASGSFDTTVQVWETATGRQVVTYQGHSDKVCSVAWSSDGSYIASASYDTTVQIWEAATGRPVYTFQGPHGHKYPVYTVAWSPDGQRIASGDTGTTDGKGGTILAWPVTLFEGNGQQTQQTVVSYHQDTGAYDVHNNAFDIQHNAVEAVAWSTDSRYLASVAHDVQIFDSFSRKHIYTYTKHNASTGQAVQAVAWSPNGRYLATGGMEGTVQVWNARQDTLS